MKPNNVKRKKKHNNDNNSDHNNENIIDDNNNNNNDSYIWDNAERNKVCEDGISNIMNLVLCFFLFFFRKTICFLYLFFGFCVFCF